jgi:protein involved in polysaccharide export with SLBB domain
MRRSLCIGLIACASVMNQAAGQEEFDTLAVSRPLATRATLEDLATRLQQRSGSEHAAAALARVRARLEEGDFQQGDRVLLEVQGEEALTDTFEVGPERELRLPSPVVGSLPLKGVLRAEFETHVTEFLGRFLQNPVVRARPLIRLSIQGEVARAGVHAVPADAVLADALMAAGGTTPDADMEKLRIERNGEAIWEDDELREALADGRTVDEARLRDGDQIVVERRDENGLTENLRFLWVIVSVAGGIVSLSRIF